MSSYDSVDDGYDSTVADDGSSTEVDAADDGYDITVAYDGSSTEVDAADDGYSNTRGDDHYAALDAAMESAEDNSIEVDSTDDGGMDDNTAKDDFGEYFDDDFVVELPQEEDLKIV
jgi:hypothetical protein